MALLGFFLRDLLLHLQADLCSFFPWLGVDPTVVKDGLNRTHHRVNRTLVKKMKKIREEEEEESQL